MEKNEKHWMTVQRTLKVINWPYKLNTMFQFQKEQFTKKFFSKIGAILVVRN